MTRPVETIRILTADGEFAPTPAAEPYLSEIEAVDDEAWFDSLREMTLTRAFDREATNLQRQGELALFAPAEGQEAAQVGSARAARPQDRLFPSYREHGALLTRGIDLVEVLALMRGVKTGGWSPDEFGVQNYCLVIASQVLHATGYAMGQRLDGAIGSGDPERDEATLVYFGDGASSQGDTSEGLVFAQSFATPQVFFLQNNQWAISVPVSVQSRSPLALRGDGFGMPSVQVDGNDLLASYAVTRHYLDRARAGDGPAFIEALTYRIGAHTTSDDPTKYRERSEEESWRRRDPIERMTQWLRGRGASDADFAALAEEAGDFAADIRRRTLALPDPDPLEMFDHASVDHDPLVERERAAYLAFEASFENGAQA